MEEADARAQVEIATPPEAVYALVSDLERLAGLTEEFHRGRWLDGATSATVGARFRGHNRLGWRRWWTTATVTDAEAGRRFAFDVRGTGLLVAHWQYDLEPTVDGCLVTERFWDRRPGWFRFVGNRILLQTSDRYGDIERNIRRTLDRLKAAAETA